MRSPLQKELLVCFKRDFQARFTDFTPGYSDRGWWTWEKKITPDLIFFIALQSFEREDQFTIEVAWSEDGKFPWDSLGVIHPDRPQGRARLSRLWTRGGLTPLWDIAPEASAAMQEDIVRLSRGKRPLNLPGPSVEVCLPRVAPLVRDALDKLEQYGIPLFRRVAESRGIEWPSEIGSKNGGEA